MTHSPEDAGSTMPASTTLQDSFLREMSWRGLIHQCTDLPTLDAHLAGAPRRAYAGFDPTADSLTIGNLVTIMALAHLQRAGHTPIVLMGGATGLIGDPSGKSAERTLQTKEQVEANVARIRKIFEGILDFDGPSAAVMVDNIQWWGGISYLDALRDVGKHFSVNMMIQKDSVRSRLENRDQGISYTEFSYMILQAYDFAHLARSQGVTLQMGGSDQWGNIVAGTDLIRRMAGGDGPAAGAPAFGLTWPLVTKADGTKFGKTESGAIWLTPERTSPFAYMQFWLNAADADVGRFLRTFTFVPRAEVERLEHETRTNPGAREAQRVLAREATAIVHGRDAMERAEAAGKALFSGEVAGLPEATFLEVLSAAPSSDRARAELDGAGANLLDLLVATGLAGSKREAKEFVQAGSVSINGKKASADTNVTAADLLHGRYTALRRGKKLWHLIRWG